MSKSVNLLGSISLTFNSLDEKSMKDQLSGIDVTTDNYITTWVMTGMCFKTVASSTTQVYGLAQLGILISSFPDVTLSYGGNSITQTTSMATAFAYGFGAGIIINKFNLGIRYYSGEPEYEQSASYAGSSSSAKVRLPATVLQLLVGIVL